MADPVRDAWEASGRPVPVPCSTPGQCARCGARGPAAPWRDVLSANFGDWDKLAWRDSGLLCAACSWGFTCKPFRLCAHVFTSFGFEQAGVPVLRDVLSRPVGRHMLVSVPVARQKHIVPYAPYGVVATDHEHLPWTAADAERLGVLAGLRAAGFGEGALAEPAPRWLVLRKLPPGERRMVLQAWPDLAPWRERPSYLAVACRATRKPKEEEEEEADGG